MNDQQTMHDIGKTLLIGVSGGTGHQVVRGMRAKGVANLVAMTRDTQKPSSKNLEKLGVELIEADLDSVASLKDAMTGVENVYLHALSHDAAVADALEVERGANVAAAAAANDIRHLVYNSAEGCDRRTGVDHMDNVARVEMLIDRAGVPNTALRATLFMEEWFKHYTRPGILNGTFSICADEDAVQQYVSVRDLGYIAAQIFQNPDRYAGQKISLASDELTALQLAEAFSHASQKAVRFKAIPIEVFKSQKGMEQMVALLEWYKRDGYKASVEETRKKFPGIWTMSEFLENTHWRDPSVSYESFSDGSFDV